MLIRCEVCHTMNKIPWMPDQKTPLMCRECGHHFTTEYVTKYVREFNGDIMPDENSQKELPMCAAADIDQAADAWVQDIKNQCVTLNTFNVARANDIMVRALTAMRAVSVCEIREALEQISPLLSAFGKGDLREVERTLKIINGARDKYPL